MQQKGRFYAPEIVLQNVTVGYGERTVLENITTVLPAGQISVILGGSGCGKSTLLRNILGLVSLQSGVIRLGDVDLYGMTDQEAMAMRRRLGVLFQDGALLGSMPLGQNVALPLREHTALDEGMIEEVVRMKLKLVGLEPFVHYFPRQLSGGMRKRAGLARAMALDPAILLCDEPTSGLDPITSADLDQLILELKATFPMTIVVVTHDLDSLFTIADFVVVLDKGKMLFQGSLEELKKNTDPFIVRFLGRMPTRESRVIAGGSGVGGRASLASPPGTTLT
jgi:phospholipid/cholesterol/gamma-HCH transport system ATP-binding protein